MTVVDSDLEAATVDAWHLHRLLELHVPYVDAIRLARRQGIEWDNTIQRLAELVGRGCHPATAVRIVE